MALHSEMPVSKITVGDYDAKRQIDADKAYWVIGGERMGVMTARAKWAFETKQAAGRPRSRKSCARPSKTCMKTP